MSEETRVNEAERISKVIFEYAAQIGRERDADKLLALISKLARDLVNADRCSIWLVDTETNELWTKVAHGEGEIRIPEGAGIVGACISDGKPILVNDTTSDKRFLGRVDKKTGYVTSQLLVVPLRSSNDEVMGAFQALNKEGGFVDGDIDLLNLAASYSANSIEEQRYRKEAEKARLLMQEFDIAREVQSQLFPKHLPDPKGVEYFAYCRPAKFVGGDYYDYFWLADGNVGITLGDVAGKGIAAAIMMASIQSSLRSLMLTGISLDKLMDQFNQTVYESSPASRYSTLFCAIYEPASCRLSYVNGGQEHPLLVRNADGDEPVIDKLQTGGLPVGLVPGMKYELESTILRPGDLLVCFSDGITEVPNTEGEWWEESFYTNLIWKNRMRPVKEMIGILVEAAEVHADGAEQHDDMTVAAFRVLP
jgi:phosphoserine phosphatase RsbU/P